MTTRRVAIAAWAVGLVVYTFTIGLPDDRAGLLLWVTLGVLAASVGRHRTKHVLLDFVPLALIMVGYDYLRGVAPKLGMPTHWFFQLRADRAMFGGTLPSVWLQERLKHATPQWWESLVALCYLSYFVLPFVTAAALWLRNRRDFYRWTARYVALCLLCYAFYTLTPSAPPWAAARCHAADVVGGPAEPPCMRQWPYLAHGGLVGKFTQWHEGAVPYLQRISSRGLRVLHLDNADALLRNTQHISDPVAAVPSLHSAGVLLFVIFMYRRVRPRWRPLLVLYPLAMTFTLVYAGEHYVSDVLLGWLAAVAVSVAAILVERRLARRGEEVPEPEPALESVQVG